MRFDLDTLEIDEAVLAAAPPEQLVEWERARARAEFEHWVSEFLLEAVPDMPPADRAAFAAEIAGRARPGESHAEAARRFARESVRELAREELKSTRLEPQWARNDTGNGERFASEHGDRFRFLSDRNVWVAWDGKRWADAAKTQVQRAAKKTAKRMLAEALRRTGGDAEEDQKWAFSSLQAKGVTAMINSAMSEKVFDSTTKDFNQYPDLINVENGTVDLRTGEIRPHNRDDLMTTLSRVRYNPRAECPRWMQFLREVFCGDEELIEFIQRAVGYSMTAHTREHAFFVLHGGGRNGKGRFIKQLMALMGDLARTTSFQTFTAQRHADGGGNTPALASLFGARLVSAGEPDQGVRLSESTIKSLTGEDEIQVCRKHEHPFEFVPVCKIWVHCNHKPVIRGTDEGIWSRPRLIPFHISFMTREEAAKKGIDESMRRDPDRHLDVKLTAEREGIFAWAVRGARKWYSEGLGSSRVVDEATRAYREESDQLGPFIDECITSKPGNFVANDKMFECYSAWCRRNLVDFQMPGQTLSKQLAARGFARGKDSKDVRGFRDIALVQTANLFVVPSR